MACPISLKVAFKAKEVIAETLFAETLAETMHSIALMPTSFKYCIASKTYRHHSLAANNKILLSCLNAKYKWPQGAVSGKCLQHYDRHNKHKSNKACCEYKKINQDIKSPLDNMYCRADKLLSNTWLAVCICANPSKLLIRRGWLYLYQMGYRSQRRSQYKTVSKVPQSS